MNTVTDFKVADLSLADFGRREIELAEAEMPALMYLRHQYSSAQPLAGARILGCLHMTVQTAVLIETLLALGAEVRWSSCNQFSTQDHAAAALARDGVPIYAWKGESESEYEWCIRRTIEGPEQQKFERGTWNANLLLDDGGDLTALVLDEYPELVPALHGVSEETTTGVRLLVKRFNEGALPIPAIDVNSAFTKCKNDNRVGTRHSLNDAIKRGTDMLLSGKKALVFGYGDVGKGSAASLVQEKMIVRICEVDPICAMQALHDGFEVVSPYKDGKVTGKPEDIDPRWVPETDVFVTATGCVNVCDSAILQRAKAGAVVCNIGHFDNEIDVEFLRNEYDWTTIKDQVHLVRRSSDSKDFLLLLSEGRLVNLGNATGHPSRVMDGSFANQVQAQIRLYSEKFAQRNDEQKPVVHKMPRDQDEEIAAAIVRGLGGDMTQLTQNQASYLGVNVDGPFKSEDYHY